MMKQKYFGNFSQRFKEDCQCPKCGIYLFQCPKQCEIKLSFIVNIFPLHFRFINFVTLECSFSSLELESKT